MLGVTIDKFIVSSLFTPSEYAIYARGAFDLPLVGILPGMLFDLMAPRFVEFWLAGKKQEIVRLLQEAMRRTALVFYPIMCLSIVLAHDLITFLFTDKYEGSVPIFRMYLLLMIFHVGLVQVIFRVSANNIQAFKLMTIKIFLGALFIIGFLKLTGGMLGAVAGVVLAHGLTTLCTVYLAAKELRLSAYALLPWHDLAKTLLLSATVAMLIVPITWWEAPKWLVLLTGGSVFVLLFVPAALYLDRFSPSDRLIVQRWVSIVAR
jgi:O-antigen/teichoic acid export membrane protein